MVNKGVNNRGNKKGQVKVQQMAFMILGLTLFFVLVGLFALSFVFSGIKDSKNLLDEQQATLLVQKLANSPEFTCGTAFGTEKTNCVDLDKVWEIYPVFFSHFKRHFSIKMRERFSTISKFR